MSNVELLLLIHPTTGVFAMLAAAWVFIETLNVREENLQRIRLAALLVAVLFAITWVTAGYWYVIYYPIDRALIKAGPAPWAHLVVMEMKEHMFLASVLLAFFLPMVVYLSDLVRNRKAQVLTMTTAALTVASVLVFEGAGAVISLGTKVGMVQ